ncbi:MAG: M24 family metallopeptidase [Erysipelotrichaceae bacterium]|jgi:Xaa-Pro aminopeptidase|nr:M24 family metallopeptidase [Erysipelotrichaceae bacterium]
MRNVLPLKDQYALMDEVLKKRLDELLPKMMRETGIDCWVVLCKEYNEDPCLPFITPTSFPTARRLTCLIFYDDGKTVKRYNAGRPDHGLAGLFENTWKLDEEEQYEGIKRVLTKLAPKVIGLNYSSDFAFGDGLTKSLYDEFKAAMTPAIMRKVVSAEKLVIRYLETRLPVEQARYRTVAAIAQDIIEEAFSAKQITPGLTTTGDLEWFMMQATNDLGCPFWFPPTVDIQRPGIGMIDGNEIILPGDLLHCDYGLVYLGLCTDTQRLCYVGKPGEVCAPSDLLEAMAENDRFQDIVTENYATGKTGNDLLMEALEKGKAAGMRPILYTHPIGTYGHGPGPIIGLWNQQAPIEGRGDWPLYYDTNYALELTTIHYVPSFGFDVRMMTEETIQVTASGVEYLMPGREKIIFVSSDR